MSWFLFAFLCALLLSASSILEKRVLQTVHSIDFSVANSLLNLLFSIPFIFLIRWEALDPIVIMCIFCAATLAAISFLLVAKGMRHLEISTVSPLLSLSPGMTALLAFFVLGEKLTPLQVGGVVCMIVGSYILTMQAGKGLFEPMKLFFKSQYVRFIILSLLFYSFGAIVDRFVLFDLKATVPVYMFFFHTSVALLYIPIAWRFGGSIQGTRNALVNNTPDLVFSSIFTVGYRYFQMEALQIASVGLVSAVKRSSSLFITIIGGELFHENHLKRKVLALSVIIIGSLFIIV